MNKNGFTLIELLATIVIIGIIMSLVMPSASRVSRNNKERLFKEYENMMIEYAKVSEYKENEIINLSGLDELDKVKDECQGYVTINHNVDPPEYKAYIKCDEYTTPDYSETLYNQSLR